MTRTQQILALALKAYGIGAKTASGYGRATTSDALPVSPAEAAAKIANKPNEQLESFRTRIESVKGAAKDVKKELSEIVKSIVKKKLPAEAQKELALLMKARLDALQIDASKTNWWSTIEQMA